MTQRPFKQVDVFTDRPYLGNPLAVVLDGSGLDDEALQRFARWTNLSETTFLLPPTDPAADYRVRIFTPGGELPFAGPPPLGSCHAWQESGGRPKAAGLVVQQCEVGLIKIRRGSNHEPSAFAAPPLRRSLPDAPALAQVLQAMGLQAGQVKAAQVLDNGPVWLGLWLDSPDTVLQLAPDHLALKNIGIKVGVAAAYVSEDAPPLIGRRNREAQAFASNPSATRARTESMPNLEVRAFAAPLGVNEDPVTGSLNASLAQWLIAEGLMPERYIASQGLCLGRAGLVYLQQDSAGQVWVGGHAVTCVDGTVQL